MAGTAGMKPQAGRIRLIVCTAGAALILGVSLAGCTSSSAQPTVTGTRTTATAPTSAASADPDPTLEPELSASENLAYFDVIALGVLAADPVAGGRAFIDALVVGGFDKAQMEVTFDKTAVDLTADSIQFSVRFAGECLIGQNGPATDGYHSAAAPILGTGTCLVGSTRQIDW